jgi:predicted PurR-regulated permease PerM
MFKLLIGFILIGLFIIVGYVIYKVVIDVTKQSTPRQPNETLNIDDVIEELEFKITRVEIQAEKGIKSAEETLKYLKIDLEKARNLKNKINK